MFAWRDWGHDNSIPSLEISSLFSLKRLQSCMCPNLFPSIPRNCCVGLDWEEMLFIACHGSGQLISTNGDTHDELQGHDVLMWVVSTRRYPLDCDVAVICKLTFSPGGSRHPPRIFEGSDQGNSDQYQWWYTSWFRKRTQQVGAKISIHVSKLCPNSTPVGDRDFQVAFRFQSRD